MIKSRFLDSINNFFEYSQFVYIIILNQKYIYQNQHPQNYITNEKFHHHRQGVENYTHQTTNI